MRSTKDQLVKRRSHACETQCFPVEPSDVEESLSLRLFVCFRFSSGLDEEGKKGSTAADSGTVRLADCGTKPSSLRAQAQLV
ncbi:hypothetical protein TNCV_3894921 [Trichonephila clavipes]|nr:hypothetical protein TNCV_3894921 [Trichonephila clavipes]